MSKKISNDNEYPIADDFPPRISPGEYDAICYRTETGIAFGGAKKIYLRFRIVGGDYDGTELFMACTFPLKKKITYRYKYYEQWTLANGSPPSSRQALTPKIFLNRMFRVQVRDTNRNMSNGRSLPDFTQYSVVDSIIKPLTGGGNNEQS